jgi:hypothetical protein
LFLHSSFILLHSPRGHRAAQFHRATGGDGQRLERSNGFQQSQIMAILLKHLKNQFKQLNQF